MNKALGNHILIEFMNCDPAILNDVATIEKNMVDAASKAGATVINSTFHHFSPYGVSGVVVIQESHLAIHTWPEWGYSAVDLFTCGEIDAWISFDYLKNSFGSDSYSAIEIKRGSVNLLKRNDFKISENPSRNNQWQNPDFHTRNVWFTDKDEDQALSLRYTGDILHDQQSSHQRVRILESYKYGKILTLDNMVMTTQKDEYHYHEMISHIAMFTHHNPKNILVIGGGDGGTIREILRHENIDKVTMVEIDGEVIEACKKHLPEIACSLNHHKLDLIVGDGISFVKNSLPKTYDIIIVDGSDPVGPAEGLFGNEFYQNCFNALKDDGILVSQGESPKFNEKVFVELNQTLKNIFGEKNTKISLFYVPTYPTGMWSFQYGIKNLNHHYQLEKITDKNSIDEFVAKQNLRYYNESIHQASFALPNFVKKLIE
jgi:spermidine synthase